MDLTKLSDSDLMALKTGKLSNVSDAGLMALKGEIPQVAPPQSAGDALAQGAGNLGAGLVRGAGSIGATLLAPVDAAARAMGVENDFIGRTDRRQAMDAGLQNMGAEPDSLMYQGGKLAGEIAGTAGAGGVLAKGVTAIPKAAAAAPNFVNALRSSGMTTGAAPTTFGTKAADLATRTAAGGAAGGAATGLVNPGDAGGGTAIGAALPGTLKALGAAGSVAGEKVASLVRKGVSEDAAKLAVRAKELGIDIPADRLVNSRPLNALTVGLNYVPFSGRAGTEDLMASQLNRALSKTFGQDTPNVTQALRKANDKLGLEFENTLSKNGVQFDEDLLNGLSTVYNKAEAELGKDALKPIKSKIDDIMTKGADGVIDGRAAYNIKKDLDRLGRGNGNEAFHALELKGVLMDALNRSLGPEKAAAFATTRKQYGNMLALEKLAKNGAEGEISAARLANMKNINNAELQELADIAGQFVKPREGQHGGAQRALVGAAAALGGGLPATLAGIGAGRVANTALNSNRLRNLMIGEETDPGRITELLTSPKAKQLLYRTAPVAGGQ